jgi:ribosomal protein L14E/L6E/L27E
MGKFLKSGKVVIMLSGRYAGKKAVIVKTFDDGNQERKFGHCIVAGVDRQPRKITRVMSKTKQQKRSKIKPFVKFVNYNHIMPTRYGRGRKGEAGRDARAGPRASAADVGGVGVGWGSRVLGWDSASWAGIGSNDGWRRRRYGGRGLGTPLRWRMLMPMPLPASRAAGCEERRGGWWRRHRPGFLLGGGGSLSSWRGPFS